MDLEQLRASLAQDAPPQELSLALQGLWWDAKGDWDKAHSCAQKKEDAAGCWVHAYLHRKEGDVDNAGYWYRRAGKLAAASSLEQEWQEIATGLLTKAGNQSG